MAAPKKQYKVIQRSFSIDERVYKHFDFKKIKQVVNNALKELKNEDSYKEKYGN